MLKKMVGRSPLHGFNRCAFERIIVRMAAKAREKKTEHRIQETEDLVIDY